MSLILKSYKQQQQQGDSLMQITAMVRTFSYNGLQLPDPDSRLTPEQVRDFYASAYPEVTTASIEGPEASDGALKYRFTRALGTKG
jgi:PRTRC genetic system protein C